MLNGNQSAMSNTTTANTITTTCPIINFLHCEWLPKLSNLFPRTGKTAASFHLVCCLCFRLLNKHNDLLHYLYRKLYHFTCKTATNK